MLQEKAKSGQILKPSGALRLEAWLLRNGLLRVLPMCGLSLCSSERAAYSLDSLAR